VGGAIVIRRVLIANRGEIAVRIVRACRELGIESVAVYSDADASAPHAVMADRAVRIGPPPASESYLRVGAVVDAARETGADALHPGYGFLAERPELAEACDAAGVIFIGPTADAIARMGDKVEARRLMLRAGVPIVPGEHPPDQSDEGIGRAAERVGLPVLVKPAAGGGGKGMRAVHDAAHLAHEIGAARREAVAAFGDGTLYVERLVDRPRHVEVQVFGDGRGKVIHLFERECSAQRRHQKVIEESPSPALTPALRDRMGEAAVAAAQAVGYRNAGTVEFLLEGEGDEARFYFLEMNTRLQVEHPVTEAVTGVDLVRAQLHLAAGEPLPWTQDQLSQRGHAIECRVYAEDSADFLPQAGALRLYREPSGPGIRVDSGVREGSDISVHYDPLIAKLIASAETREAAIERALSALRRFAILGIRTNVAFLIRLLAHDAFRSGTLDTGFIERHRAELAAQADVPDAVAAVAAVADRQGTAIAGLHGEGPPADPWDLLAGWTA
jgi:acetyl-CoA carboxylase biotin carboxylase subunit